MLPSVIVAEISRRYRRSIQKEHRYYATPTSHRLYAQCARSGCLGIDSAWPGVPYDTVCNSWFDTGALARSADRAGLRRRASGIPSFALAYRQARRRTSCVDRDGLHSASTTLSGSGR